MAISKNIQTKSGIDIQNAYIRVENVAILEKIVLQFMVRSYKDKRKPFVEEELMTCKYDIAGSNPIIQAYTYLKALPNFAGAIDC